MRHARCREDYWQRAGMHAGGKERDGGGCTDHARERTTTTDDGCVNCSLVALWARQQRNEERSQEQQKCE
jgi:hypothetical protein